MPLSPVTPQQQISVVVLAYNQLPLTQRCLGSLIENSRIARELIVVDNHSTDETPRWLESFSGEARSRGWSVQVIRNEANRGFGRAMNQGAGAATGSHVVLLNNDTWLMPGWDEALLDPMNRLGADMVSPHYYEGPFSADEMPGRAQGWVRRNRGRYSREWGSILMLFKRESFERIGRFDERFFVTYEDTDLRERMDRAGMRYYRIGDCFIWHHSKATRETQPMPSNYEQEGLRIFMEKWGFDPRERDARLIPRLRRRWASIRRKRGVF